jgi:hypothetical protein
MEKLSYNKLDGVKAIKSEDTLRFGMPQSRAKFISRALYDNLFVFPKEHILYAVILVLALIIDVSKAELNHFLKAICIVLCIKGYHIYLVNKIYTSFKNSRMFPVIDKDGVAQVATYAEHGGYIVISSVKWIHIEAIRFYSDFISIQIKDRKDIELGGTLIHIMADNALKYKDEVASIWAYALKNPNDKLGLMLYSEKEENEISEYIEKHYGVFDNVLHEIASPDIHLDIAMIPASEDRNYITLCTIGAGAYRMHIDKKIRIGYGLIERAEYVLFLPPDWKLDNESLKDEKYYWPFRVLKDAARLPVRTESWLGYGHTISPTEGDLLTESMPYDSVLLTYPVPEFGTKQYADLSSGKSVNFFQVHPLTPDELQYKAESTTPELLERIYPEEDDAMEIYLNRMKLQE